MLKGISVVGTTAEEYTHVKTRRRWIHLVVVVVVVAYCSDFIVAKQYECYKQSISIALNSFSSASRHRGRSGQVLLGQVAWRRGSSIWRNKK